MLLRRWNQSAAVKAHLVEDQELRLASELNRQTSVSQRSLVAKLKALMKTKRSSGSVMLVICGTLALALTGCTTYVEQRPVRTVYVPPPVAEPPPVVVTPVEPPVVVIQSESDFYD